jgi:F0F1-type ATP synthase assembly protein I
MAEKPQQPSRKEASWYRLIGLGFEFFVSVLACGAIGWWLDGRFKTEPWLMVVGAVIGFAAGLWMMIQAALESFRN